MNLSWFSALTGHSPERDSGIKLLIDTLNCETGVEIGTRFGWFANYLLSQTNLKFLFAVDIDRQPNIDNVEKQFIDRYKFIHKDSILASKEDFSDNSLDFIYHDGNHSEDYVYKELLAWWPKLKSGKVMSGDDYMEYQDETEGKFGVIEAVNRFCSEKGLQLHIIGQNDLDINNLTKYGIQMGKELINKIHNRQNNFISVPNWYIIKP